MKNPQMEYTFVMIKPDALQRRLAGTIIHRIESKGLQLIAVRMVQLDESTASIHYRDHLDKPFFPRLSRFITSGPVIAMVWRGFSAIRLVRTLVGATSPDKALPGTIRGDFAQHTTCNLVHASDSTQSATREIDLFFPKREFFEFPAADENWLHPPE